MPIRADRLALRFSVVGPGRVGSSIARWLVNCGAHLDRVAGRTAIAGETLARELGGRSVGTEEFGSSTDDLLLIAVDDAAVAEVASALAARPQARLVMHTAGAVPVEALAALRHQGSAVGGMHPLRAFPTASLEVADAIGVLFAIGGDPAAVETAQTVVRAWGGCSVPIEDTQRPLYHLAASLAAGGVVTLLATAAEISSQAGLPPDVVAGYHALAQQALQESERMPSPATAITGPVARADRHTVEKHLKALVDGHPAALEVVVAVARETLRHRAAVDGPAEDHSQLLSTLAKVMERKSFLDRA